jgi:hypothetical protein
MRQALWLLGVAAVAVVVAVAMHGAGRTAATGFAAVAAMAALIAATFLWLWWVRATPLALGMALSWSGVALVAADLAGGAGAVVPLIALPFLGVGAALHFAVMRRSMGLPRRTVLLPAGLVAAAALAAVAFTKP